MHPWEHSLSSTKKFGGKPDDYVAIHSWFDESKAYHPDVRHRAVRHHTEGIFLCEKIFGMTITNSDGKKIPTRYIGEQHVKEDLGRVPSVTEWLKGIPMEPWMLRPGVKQTVIEIKKVGDEGKDQ